MSVYVDTSAFLTLLNPNDPMYSSAVDAWGELLDRQELIITSSYVVVETTALLQSRHGLAVVRRFVDDLLPVVLTETVDVQVHEAAMSAFLAAESRRAPSLVDCAGFEMMRSRRIGRVFAYDRHFTSRGYAVVGGGA